MLIDRRYQLSRKSSRLVYTLPKNYTMRGWLFVNKEYDFIVINKVEYQIQYSYHYYGIVNIQIVLN